MRIVIFNYGVGNLYSIQTALKREGVQPQLTKDVRKAKTADGLLLPGVGSFTTATRTFPRNEMRDIVKSGKPLIGICLGLQLFFDRSDEGPGRGLGIFPGRVKRLPSTMKVPQIGWNVLRIKNCSEFVEAVANGSWVYYLHSYYAATHGKHVIATSEYGLEYPCLIAQGNVFGTQFHPEKSGKAGSMILRNFLRLVKG
jgi:glutamine amidotransferase